MQILFILYFQLKIELENSKSKHFYNTMIIKIIIIIHSCNYMRVIRLLFSLSQLSHGMLYLRLFFSFIIYIILNVGLLYYWFYVFWIFLFSFLFSTEPPSARPVLSGGLQKYDVNDTVDVTCTSAPSRPPTKLTWHINDQEVS